MKNILNRIQIDYMTYILLFFALIAGYVKVMFIIFTIVLIHEFGHVFFLWLFKIPIVLIKIYPFGGLTIINKKIHERIYKDIIVGFGGIIFQIIFLYIIFICYKYGFILNSTYFLLVKYNWLLIIFNMLPIIPLDGSKILNAFLNMFISFRSSYFISIYISLFTLIIFILFNCILKINDVVIYVFFIFHLFDTIKNYGFFMNKFYLERVMYNHYYNGIINNVNDINKLRIDKYYYFYDRNRYINEKDFIKRRLF